MFRKFLVLLASASVALVLSTGHAASPESEAAADAVDYIMSLQNDDAGFPAFGPESSPGSTIDALFALHSAGVGPPLVNKGASPFDYLAAQAPTYTVDAGAAAKLTLAVVLAGLDPGQFGGLDLFSVLEGHFDETVEVYGLDLFDEALYIFAVVAAGEPLRPSVPAHLRSVQADDGGWEFTPGSGSDSNTTAIALQAHLAAGGERGDSTTQRALAYLRTVQTDDGGFGFLPGEPSDPSSTAFAVQALVAAGEDIDAGGPWAPNGNTPLEGLLQFRNATTGAFQFAGGDSPFATYQAVPGLMLAPFPLLETRPDGAPPAPTALPVTEPVPATSTAAPVPDALPPAGTGGSADAMWPVAALALAGCAAIGAAAAAGRRR